MIRATGPGRLRGVLALVAMLQVGSVRAYDIVECDGDTTFGNAGIVLGWATPTAGSIGTLLVDDQGGVRSGLTGPQVTAMWTRSMSAWEAVGGSTFRFPAPTVRTVTGTEIGNSLYRAFPPRETLFAVVQATTVVPSSAVNPSSATGWDQITMTDGQVLGLTFHTSSNLDRRWLDGDILINDDSAVFPYSEPVTGATLDMESVILHELGHLIGLAHTTRPSSLMAPALGVGTVVGISGDDASGLRFLYPDGSITPPNPDRNNLAYLDCTTLGPTGPIVEELQPDPESGGCLALPGGHTPVRIPATLVLALAWLLALRLAATRRRVRASTGPSAPGPGPA